MKTRYNIYYTQYILFANANIPKIRVVETEDIYHEVGKMICSALEKIVSISYTHPRASIEECEKYWRERGYRKISNDTWVMDKPVVEKKFRPLEAERKLI